MDRLDKESISLPMVTTPGMRFILIEQLFLVRNFLFLCIKLKAVH